MKLAWIQLPDCITIEIGFKEEILPEEVCQVVEARNCSVNSIMEWWATTNDTLEVAFQVSFLSADV